MKKAAFIAGIFTALSAILYIASFWYWFMAPVALLLSFIAFSYAFSKRHNPTAAALLVLLCIACSAPPFYSCGYWLVSKYLAPSAEIILPNGFKGKFAIASEHLAMEISLQNLTKHYIYAVPDNGYLHPSEGWIYLSHANSMRKPHTIFFRYENGTPIAFQDVDCVYYDAQEMEKTGNIIRTVDSPTKGIICSINESKSSNEIEKWEALQSFVKNHPANHQ